ncbi:TonB-dependent receptor [Vaginella massiliensis]|uniref:TonB-dependent receptor n=1 Tax=Vaginella massiliensis TaxID=1816680 RepID=UPI003752CA69
MNKLLLSISFFLLSLMSIWGQTKVHGVVKNVTTDSEVYNLNVRLIGFSDEPVISDRIGYFQFVEVPNGSYTLQISGPNYDLYQQTVTVSNEFDLDLGNIFVTYNPAAAEVGLITLSEDEVSSDESSLASNSGILQSSRDIFASVSAYELGAYWFKPRGYDNKYNDIHFNGIRMNKIDNGRATFNNWGGLNDVTRRPQEITYGIEPSETAFGDIGGVTNFDTRPSTMRKGVGLAYSISNRSYRHRVMGTYNTGLMKNGWAFMVSGSRRWAEEGVIEGTFYDAWAYFLGIEKKFNENHTLNFTAFGAPNRRAGGSPNTQEMVDLKGIYYNSYWGWQDGEKRNERVRKTFEPVFQLTHHWNFDLKSKLTTTFSYQFGKDSGTRLDWYRAGNPSPTYYRNLPSYYLYANQGATTSDMAYIDLVNKWRNGDDYAQINWNSLYQANYNMTNYNDGRSVYWLGRDVTADKVYAFNTNLSSQFNENIDFIIALAYQRTKSDLYKEVADLLGGEYVKNADDYASNTIANSYDMNNPTYIARKGDRYEYNYEINRNYADLFFQSKIKGKFLDVTIGAHASYTDFYRDGKYRHYLYQDLSYGKSATYDFWNFGIKSQFLFKLDGRNFITWNGQYSTEAPTADEVFPNARLHEVTINEINNAEILSTDLSYVYRAPRLKARATAYFTQISNETDKSFGYIDGRQGTTGSNTYFAAEVLTGVDKQHIGAELAVEGQVTPTIKVFGVASLGQFTYTNNPKYYLFSDDLITTEYNNGSYLSVGEAYQYFGDVYLKNYRIAAGPQNVGTLGLEYRSPKFWWIGASANYLADNYIDIAAYRRTPHFVAGYTGGEITESSLREALRQTKTSDEFMFNLNAGYSKRIGKYYALISGSVNNLFDNKEYITGGFEQLRLGSFANATNPAYRTMMGPKYWYGIGRSYFVNIIFRF